MRTVPNRWISGFASCLVELFRNVPLLVQLFMIYYGVVHFNDGFVPGVKAFTAAVLGGIGSLPGAMLGPGFTRSTSTTDVIESIRLGGMKNGTPNANLPAVDVRDVVEGHILAAESSAGGRFILCNDRLPPLAELARVAHEVDPAIPLPGKVLPDFALALGPLFDWLNHRTKGAPRTIGPEFIAAVRGKEWTMSNQRARQELGWRPTIPLEQSVADTLATLKSLHH